MLHSFARGDDIMVGGLLAFTIAGAHVDQAAEQVANAFHGC